LIVVYTEFINQPNRSSKMSNLKPLEVMKRDDGSFAVRWSNKPKRWAIIKEDDKIMFEFIVFLDAWRMSEKTHGGAGRGQGRKPALPHLKKVPVSLKLPRWLIAWLDSRPESRAVLIEAALCERHVLNPESFRSAFEMQCQECAVTPNA
jgi:hypothetical protein